MIIHMNPLIKIIYGLLICATITICLSINAFADYLSPGADACGGIHDLLLIYSGDSTSQDWNTGDFDPYVFHLAEDGRPDDWFFDGFLFLGQTLPGNQSTELNAATPASDMNGWQWYIDRIFQKNKFIDALNTTISAAAPNLSKVQNRKIVVMIPYPSTKQSAFGDVNGDGRSEDFSKPADRLIAIKWYIDAVIERWKMARLSHLELAGFYWMEESYHPEDLEILEPVHDYLHARGMRLFWIPYYFGSPASLQVNRLGFDCIAKQPNYFFPRWRAEKSRVASTARTAKKFGMGFEMEVDDTVFSDPETQYPKYLRYLNGGVEEGYMKNAFHAYYQGVRTLRRLYESNDARFHQLYDMTYRFTKGTYIPVEEKFPK